LLCDAESADAALVAARPIIIFTSLVVKPPVRTPPFCKGVLYVSVPIDGQGGTSPSEMAADLSRVTAAVRGPEDEEKGGSSGLENGRHRAMSNRSKEDAWSSKSRRSAQSASSWRQKAGNRQQTRAKCGKLIGTINRVPVITGKSRRVETHRDLDLLMH